MDAAEFARKKSVRGAQRAAITKVIGQVKDLTSRADIDKARLKQRKLTLEEKREMIKKLDAEILEAVPDTDLEAEIDRADEVLEQLELAIILIEETLRRCSSRPVSPSSGARPLVEPTSASVIPSTVTPTGGDTPTITPITAASTEGVPPTHTTAASTEGVPPTPTTVASTEGVPLTPTTAASTEGATPAMSTPTTTVTTGVVSGGASPTTVTHTLTSPYVWPTRVKLPEIAINRFNGDLTKWSTFWDTFESTIHKHPTLSAVEKFNYLRSLLESGAADAVAGLPLTAANYGEAVSILQRRYGNKQLIISRHMDVLMGLESVSTQHDTRRLRRLFDTVETQVRGLKALGVPIESYGGLLSSILLNKLPSEIRLIMSRALSGDSWDLGKILELFEAELTAREMATTTCSQQKRSPLGRSPPTASTLMTPTASSCVYCGQNHSSASCSTVPTTEARKQSLRQSGRCYVCLRRNHISRNCRSQMKCSQCRGRHHISICQQSKGQGETTRGSLSETGSNSTPTTTPVLYVNNKTRVMLQTATVVVHGSKGCRPTYRTRAVLDCGSQRTYVTSHVQRTLSLPTSGTEMVEIRTFGSSEGMKCPCNVVSLHIITRDGCTVKISALVVPHICDAITHPPLGTLTREYPHLMSLDLADSDESDSMAIGILIGADHYWTLVSGRVQRGGAGPVALETRIGWVLSGPMEGEVVDQSIVGFVNTYTLRVDTLPEQMDVDEGLKRFWELESIGIKPLEESVHTKFNQEIAFKNGRYEVSLPWRKDQLQLPENYNLCLQRLQGLHQRLQRDPELLRAYDGVIREQLKNGIIEEVSESMEPQNKVHYLPHHPVVRRDKATTKIRVVYDASCSEGAGLSLNQCLHVGPSFGQSILDILIRFRMHKVALVGDVEKAFLMVSMAEKDRDVLRFLWFSDPFTPSPTPVKYRFTRVVFGVASSPFLLNATIRHHVNRYSESDPIFVSKFLRGIYVDDLTTGASSKEDCYEFYLKSKMRLAEAGFNLRKFVSNSSSLLSRIATNEEQLTGVPYSSEMAAEYKVLGVLWNPTSDQMIFDIRMVAESLSDLEPTKRSVVGAASRIYDPLGILSPITICFKILFQRLCLAKIGWDDRLPGELLHQWQTLTSMLSQVKPVVVPRYSGMDGTSSTSLQLVGFCDASQSAYAAVVYLRITTEDTSTITILAAKTRVAPLKAVTIPRLELLSALLLSRLIHSISCALKDEIPLDSPICFTDSQIALCWVRHIGKEWKQFVENRVSEIRRLVPFECWHHCPGVENPADLPSRGLSPVEFEGRLEFWLQGPDWLKEPLCLESASEALVSDECLLELRNHNLKAVTLCVPSVSIGGATIIDVEHFSSYKRLLRVMAQVFRFIRVLRCHLGTGTAGGVSAKDMGLAHDYLIRTSQAILPQNNKFELWTRQFGLFMDSQGLWRCKGRLSNANIPQETMYPIFLERKATITQLIIKDCHERVKHGGANSTLAELRSRYWVVRGRQLVKEVIHNCVLCRRFQGKSYQAPPPPPLPFMRVDERPPFSYTGVDFAGPLYTRETLSSGSRKVWICLFTCCVTRAVHIDLVTEMKATAFLRSFKRFAARRGMPIKVLSDNAKTFKAADKFIASVINHPLVQSHLADNKINWQFNVEKAPWWGGVFERMIQSTKRLLRKIIGTTMS